MFFDEKPQELPIGSFAKGNPSTLGEMWESSRDYSKKITNDFTVSHQLEDEYAQRIDEVKKATGVSLDNPMLSPTAEDDLEIETESRATKRSINAREWQTAKFERKLKELSDKHPDLSTAIKADRMPSAIVHERLRAVEDREGDLSARYGMVAPYNFPGGAIAAAGVNVVTSPIGTATQMAGGISGWFRAPTADNWSIFDTYSDPATLLLLPFAGSKGASLIKNMVRGGLANAGQQTLLEPAQQQQRKMAGLDYGWERALTNIGAAGVMGGIVDVGFRAPNRIRAKVLGKPGYGGVLQDAPELGAPTLPDTILPDIPDIPLDLAAKAQAGDTEAMAEVGRLLAEHNKPALPEGVTPSLVEKALGGDLGAVRSIGEKTGLMDDPKFRGALDYGEMYGALDADMKATLKELGVDAGDGLRAQMQALKAAIDLDEMPPARGAEPVIEAPYKFDLEQAAVIAEDAGRVAALKAAVGPQLAAFIGDVVDTGLSDALPELKAALGKVEDDPVAAATSFAKAMAEMPEAAIAARIYAGRGSVLDIATALRGGMPVDNAMPLNTGLMQTARAIASLSDDAYTMVADGTTSPDMAAMVADRVGNKDLHTRVLRDLATAGIKNAAEAARALPDLLPSGTQAANDILLGVRRDSGMDEMPLLAGAEVDDPAGAAAKKQTERLAQELAPEIKQALADGPPPLEPVRTAAEAEARLSEVRQAIASVAGIVPAETPVQVFSSLADLPPDLAEHVTRANGVIFADALRRFKGAASEEQRAQARSDMDAAKEGRGIEGISHDDTIWIATYALEPGGRVAHEVVHALRNLGKLSPDEIGLLAERSRKTAAFTPEREAIYRAEIEGRGLMPDRVSELLDEEAAAHLIEARVRGVNLGRSVNGIVDRVVLVLKQIGNALRLRGFKTADDVMSSILSGEAAKRQGVDAWRRENGVVDLATSDALSVRPYSSAPPIKGFAFRGPTMFAVRAFHGSPHDFDKFDASKIGSGEGAQAYGHGLYFAESPEVAQSYKNTGVADFPSKAAADAHVKATAEALAKGLPPPEIPGRTGRMYEVSIKADPDQFLDWDKPLTAHDEKTIAKMKAAGVDFHSGGRLDLQTPEVTARLREQGIPGIRYKDAGSRVGGGGFPDTLRGRAHELKKPDENKSLYDAYNAIHLDKKTPDEARKLTKGDATRIFDEAFAARDKEGGTYNYVVFPGNENLIEIIAKDGKPLKGADLEEAIAKIKAAGEEQRPAASGGGQGAQPVPIESIGPKDPSPPSVIAYHATKADFDTLDAGKSSDFAIHFGSKKQAAERLKNEVVASRPGKERLIPVELNIRNALTLEHDLERWTVGDLGEALEKVPGLKGINEETQDLLYKNSPGPMRIGKKTYPNIPAIAEADVKAAYSHIKSKLEGLGYDGIRYWNEVEGDGWSYAVWNKGKVKSATTGETLFSMRDNAERPGLDPEAVSALSRQAMELMQPYLMQRLSGTIERGEDGAISATSGDLHSSADADLQGQAANVAMTGNMPPELQAQAASMADLITTTARETYGVDIDPARAAEIGAEAVSIMREAPSDAAAAAQGLSNLFTRVMDDLNPPEDQPVAGAAQDGVPSPLRQDLADIGRLEEMKNLVEVCR